MASIPYRPPRDKGAILDNHDVVTDKRPRLVALLPTVHKGAWYQIPLLIATLLRTDSSYLPA
jgi:hypothetical protein